MGRFPSERSSCETSSGSVKSREKKEGLSAGGRKVGASGLRKDASRLEMGVVGSVSFGNSELKTAGAREEFALGVPGTEDVVEPVLSVPASRAVSVSRALSALSCVPERSAVPVLSSGRADASVSDNVLVG